MAPTALATALTAWVVATPTVSAVVVDEIFTARVLAGPYAGTVGTGTFSYDDEHIVNGDETLGPPESLRLTLTVFGQTFDETDDVDYNSGEYPSLQFEGGVPAFLDFYVDETAAPPLNPTAINDPGVTSIFIQLTRLEPVVGGGFETELQVIPEPSGGVFAGVTALGLGLFAWHRRRGAGPPPTA
jgi:MYXO-CTERM domain-containing protein